LSNPFNLNLPDTFEAGTPMQGASVGVIFRANGVDANGEGTETTITYDVIVETAEGPCVMPGIRPAHRRPVAAPGIIIAAKPNDRCIVCSSGDQRFFIIFESIAVGVCE